MAELIVAKILNHHHQQNIIFLNHHFRKLYKKGAIVTLTYGQQKVNAHVRFHNKNNHIYLSSSLWKKLSFPYAHTVHVQLKESMIHIGPLVGIFTTGVHPHPETPVGRRTNMMKRYLLAQHETPSTFFVFGPQDISHSTKRINGHFFVLNDKKEGKWRRFTVPFPDVIYDRVPNRVMERATKVVETKWMLEQAGVRSFNPGFFDKWSIHESIHQIESVQPFIPETVFNPTTTAIGHLLKKHRMIYLKPSTGSLGLGVAQFYYPNDQKIYIRYHHGRNQLKRFSSVQQALAHFTKHKSPKQYIAQQGIHLIKINDRPVDFRVHTNKNKYGIWEVTAIGAKVAGKGSVTTHVRTGGHILSYEDVIKKCFPKEKQSKVLADLEQAVLLLSKAIDRTSTGYVGELGFDIGIDENGHPWMFEANSKPGRHVFNHISMRQGERLTRMKVLDYALCLANFTQKEVTVSQ